jgi:hypothetical protein
MIDSRMQITLNYIIGIIIVSNVDRQVNSKYHVQLLSARHKVPDQQQQRYVLSEWKEHFKESLVTLKYQLLGHLGERNLIFRFTDHLTQLFLFWKKKGNC